MIRLLLPGAWGVIKNNSLWIYRKMGGQEYMRTHKDVWWQSMLYRELSGKELSTERGTVRFKAQGRARRKSVRLETLLGLSLYPYPHPSEDSHQRGRWYTPGMRKPAKLQLWAWNLLAVSEELCRLYHLYFCVGNESTTYSDWYLPTLCTCSDNSTATC